jgi:carboxypeptidase D
MAFMSELATNASKHGVQIIIYEANDDALVARRSSEGAVFLWQIVRNRR